MVEEKILSGDRVRAGSQRNVFVFSQSLLSYFCSVLWKNSPAVMGLREDLFDSIICHLSQQEFFPQNTSL